MNITIMLSVFSTNALCLADPELATVAPNICKSREFSNTSQWNQETWRFTGMFMSGSGPQTDSAEMFCCLSYTASVNMKKIIMIRITPTYDWCSNKQLLASMNLASI